MKGVSMKRSTYRKLFSPALFVVAACVAAPGHSMTATVVSTTPPAAAPSAAGAAKAGTAAPNAAKVAMPNAAALTRPTPVTSAAAPAASSSAAPAKAGVARATSTTIRPNVAARPAVAPSTAAWTATSDNSSGSMRKGTLQAFNAAGTFQVYGQKLTFNPQSVKVFNAAGKPGSVFNLKTGTNIRFTMDGTDVRHRRVAMIYAN
jgi:hypothetical protein